MFIIIIIIIISFFCVFWLKFYMRVEHGTWSLTLKKFVNGFNKSHD